MQPEVTAAYASRAAEYARVLGSMDAVHPSDRVHVATWAATCAGPLVDLGCGPGHWTASLAAAGHDVVGVDPVPDFVDLARRAFPDVPFRVGSVEQPGCADGTVGGVLAWYSLIHLEPHELPRALAAIARLLVPGGRVLVGFFDGDAVEPFPHAVTTAHRWPVGAMSVALEAAGFVVEETHRRTGPGHRPHAAVSAVLG